MTQANANDPTRCPACGQTNQCSLANPLTATRACWCFDVTFNAASLTSPVALENPQACLCRACAQAQQSAKPHAS